MNQMISLEKQLFQDLVNPKSRVKRACTDGNPGFSFVTRRESRLEKHLKNSWPSCFECIDNNPIIPRSIPQIYSNSIPIHRVRPTNQKL